MGRRALVVVEVELGKSADAGPGTEAVAAAAARALTATPPRGVRLVTVHPVTGEAVPEVLAAAVRAT